MHPILNAAPRQYAHKLASKLLGAGARPLWVPTVAINPGEPHTVTVCRKKVCPGRLLATILTFCNPFSRQMSTRRKAYSDKKQLRLTMSRLAAHSFLNCLSTVFPPLCPLPPPHCCPPPVAVFPHFICITVSLKYAHTYTWAHTHMHAPTVQSLLGLPVSLLTLLFDCSSHNQDAATNSPI